jgi:SAM-dependent methyltransferase
MKQPERWQQTRFQTDARGRFTGPHMERILGRAYEPIIRKFASGRLVDLGCGNVPYYGWYRDQVSDVVCVDWENTVRGTDHLDHVADLNGPLDFLTNDTYDTVLCTDVLEHIHTPEVLISEMVRMTRPGGHIIVAVPFLYWIHEAPHDHHRYTEHKLRHWCEQHGLHIRELITYGGWPEVVFDLVYKGMDYLDLPMKRVLLGLWSGSGKVLSKMSLVKRMSERSRSTFPLGYVLVARK